MTLDIESARRQMVTQQVRAWEVLDPTVLKVMDEVPRESFVPPGYRALAFADTAIPLPLGQEMLTPQVTGRILQSLEISPSDHVLEVGTGSGFLTACLARLGAGVVSLEIRSQLADAARRRLLEHNVRNCEVLAQDVFQWEPDRSFDCIAVTGSLPEFDERLQNWLAPGGRLFVVIGASPAMSAWLIRRTGKIDFVRESLFETVLAPLDNAPRSERFVF